MPGQRAQRMLIGMNARGRSRVVVAGAGVAGLEFVLALRELAPDRAAVEMISPDSYFTYRPFAVADALGIGPPFRLPLERFAASAGVRLRRGRVVAVDAADRVVLTENDDRVAYDILLVALGARAVAVLPGALTFGAEQDRQALRALLLALDHGDVSSVAFTLPPGATWPLPLYELALLTASRVLRAGGTAHLVLVTPEERPLARFDGVASEVVSGLLETAGIELRPGRWAAEFADGTLRLVPHDELTVERVVTLPQLRGRCLSGLPADAAGFVPTDPYGRVIGVDGVYAAGDATGFPVKLGGIAVEQADAAAGAVGARLGASINPQPFRPLIRGLLLTGGSPRFLWADIAGGRGETSTATTYPLWWPPGKIAGGRLATYLRAEGLPVPLPPAGPSTVPVEVDGGRLRDWG